MRLSKLIFGAALVGAVSYGGCGGIAVIDGEDAASSSSASGSSSSSSNNASSSSGGTGSLDLELVQAFGSGDCMPAVPPDPLKLSIVVQAINGTSQSVGLTVTSGRLSSPSAKLSFEVDPNNLVIGANADQEIDFEKVPNSASGDNACALCGSTNTVVELDVLIDGNPMVLEGALNSMSCAF